MRMSQILQAELDRWRNWSLAAGGTGLVFCLFAYWQSPQHFLPGYLTAFLFWIGITLGSLAIAMIHGMTGGAWGQSIRRILEAGYQTLPLMAILFFPIWINAAAFYPWANPEFVRHHEILSKKAGYLNVTGFQGRAILYFVIWIAITMVLDRLSPNDERDPDSDRARRRQTASGLGFMIYGFTFSLASVDWGMSLEPLWYSTMYALIQIAGQAVAGLAFALLIAATLRQFLPWSKNLTAVRLNDLGNLQLASVMFWAYCSFFQFLVIWSGNLPEENIWYVKRLQGGWQSLAIGLVLLHFVIPFLLLLSRAVKRNPRWLSRVAGLLLAMRLIDLYWTIIPAPEFAGGLRSLMLAASCLSAWLAIGGLWFALFTWTLTHQVQQPLFDVLLTENDR